MRPLLLLLLNVEARYPTFLGRYPVIGYYAGARDLPLGARPLGEAPAEGRRQGALATTLEDRAGRRVPIYRILLPGGAV